MHNYFVPCQSSAGSHRVHVTEWGDAANPNVLICVHGLTRCGRDFDVMAEALADRYRVVCPDVVGRGESDWLVNKADYTYPQYVSDMVRVIAKTGQKSVHWLGTSMGGIIGMVLAAQPNTPISRMVLNDLGSFIPKASLERIGMYVGVSPLFRSVDEVVEAMRLVSPFGPLTDDQWHTLTLPLIKKTSSGMWQFRYDPAIGDSFRQQPIEDVDLSEFWDAVQCPVLLTRGAESDLLLASTFEHMCTKPNVTGVTFAATGHAPMFQDAYSIAVVRKFLLGT
ncbi:MAG: alpha/beta fold hydrolase [Burkholderiales bacterium]|nr:alpha/beta hydrolase [Betaproteobacteria bacterium]